MKASRFSDAQKAFILKQGVDGMPVADICRKAGISQATYFNWKKKYDGLLPTEMRRLKQLEDENAKLRKVVADLSLDKEMLQDALRELTTAVRLMPRDSNIHWRLARLYQAMGRKEEAKMEFEKTSSLHKAENESIFTQLKAAQEKEKPTDDPDADSKSK